MSENKNSASAVGQIVESTANVAKVASLPATAICKTIEVAGQALSSYLNSSAEASKREAEAKEKREIREHELKLQTQKETSGQVKDMVEVFKSQVTSYAEMAASMQKQMEKSHETTTQQLTQMNKDFMEMGQKNQNAHDSERRELLARYDSNIKENAEENREIQARALQALEKQREEQQLRDKEHYAETERLHATMLEKVEQQGVAQQALNDRHRAEIAALNEKRIEDRDQAMERERALHDRNTSNIIWGATQFLNMARREPDIRDATILCCEQNELRSELVKAQNMHQSAMKKVYAALQNHSNATIAIDQLDRLDEQAKNVATKKNDFSKSLTLHRNQDMVHEFTIALAPLESALLKYRAAITGMGAKIVEKQLMKNDVDKLNTLLAELTTAMSGLPIVKSVEIQSSMDDARRALEGGSTSVLPQLTGTASWEKQLKERENKN